MTTLEKLRLKIGDIDSYSYAFTDEELEMIMSDNHSANEKIMLAKSAIECVKILMANYAKRFNYKQGSSSADMSDIFKQLKEMLSIFNDELKELMSEESGTIPVSTVRIASRETTLDKPPYDKLQYEPTETDLSRLIG